MRLIDGDKLFNWGDCKLSDAVKYGNKTADQQHWSYSTVMMYEIADEIADAPTIDLVNHGKWLNFINDFSTAECSKCGEIYEVSDYKDKEHFDLFCSCYKYCPNCGAKMDLKRGK